jgi:hypothetical protein
MKRKGETNMAFINAASHRVQFNGGPGTTEQFTIDSIPENETVLITCCLVQAQLILGNTSFGGGQVYISSYVKNGNPTPGNGHRWLHDKGVSSVTFSVEAINGITDAVGLVQSV